MTISNVFYVFEQINEFIWTYIAFVLLTLLGFYFSYTSRFFQIRKFPAILVSFIQFFQEKTQGRGVHPLQAFFAAIGGCIGIGNVIGIATAIELGGPGALFWTWIGGLVGMLIQYAEVYLGMKYRIPNQEGRYDGGPMFFLPVAYKRQWIAPLVAFLLCIYGVEFFTFNVMTESLSSNWKINEYVVVAVLLVSTLAVGSGGVKRVGEVCSAIIPLFILLYLSMGIWILTKNAFLLPSLFSQILAGAFSSQAAMSGFAGSTVALTISMGLSRGAYSGDIGVGYTSIIHAESQTTHFGRQASLAIFGIFLDTFVICTMSVLLILLGEHWKSGIGPTYMAQAALGDHFPYMQFFMPLFIFLLGFSTVLAYFVVGVKCAKFLSPKWGKVVYYGYAAITLPLFAFVNHREAFLVMSFSGALLLILNTLGIIRLRKQVKFHL